jgi:hypothetical protein
MLGFKFKHEECVIIQLMSYIRQQNIGLATSTFFYFDILVVYKTYILLIDSVLQGYQAHVQ